MNNLTIQKLKDKKEIPWSLLLLADPSKKIIEKYIYDSDTYVSYVNNEVVGVYVLINLSSDTVELKNIAVDGQYQGKGIGKQLVLDAINKAKSKGAKRIEVGTGNSSLSQLALYQKCGFRIIGVEKNFFTKYYKEEIIENGIKCIDMIRLAIEL
ncbi:MAG: GNAT family N-acetyltransferase [Patescibacteria group bacterium]